MRKAARIEFATTRPPPRKALRSPRTPGACTTSRSSPCQTPPVSIVTSRTGSSVASR
ncbi:hypothetical protein [Ornithinimicrobium kibberense]|uniref:hypothetical protein n=1 Tax=Ornithinimicrobium kibberense TaxID=282060 RepID=UPI00361D19E8